MPDHNRTLPRRRFFTRNRGDRLGVVVAIRRFGRKIVAVKAQGSINDLVEAAEGKFHVRIDRSKVVFDHGLQDTFTPLVSLGVVTGDLVLMEEEFALVDVNLCVIGPAVMSAKSVMHLRLQLATTDDVKDWALATTQSPAWTSTHVLFRGQLLCQDLTLFEHGVRADDLVYVLLR